MSVTATLEDYETKEVLATQTLSIAAGTGFTQYNFSLTPSASTACADIAPGSDPAVSCGHGRPRSAVGHTCVKCGGEFKLSVTGSVLINYVFLQVHVRPYRQTQYMYGLTMYRPNQPGQWGRLPGGRGWESHHPVYFISNSLHKS